MRPHLFNRLSLCAAAIGALAASAFVIAPSIAAEDAVVIPAPVMDVAAADGLQTAVIAGGCFWGVQGVFQHTAGVVNAVSGYAGGNKSTAKYDLVSTGTTGHAESVEIKYDPKRISYGKILQIYFSVAHDPTQLNMQGPDHGRQYRSAIFYMNDQQRTLAEGFIKSINDSKALSQAVVTEVVPFKGFYKAEPEHQDFVQFNSDNDYVVYNDLPKLKELKKKFPELYKN